MTPRMHILFPGRLIGNPSSCFYSICYSISRTKAEQEQEQEYEHKWMTLSHGQFQFAQEVFYEHQTS